MSDYNELVDSYYRAWFRFQPEAAVDMGVDGYSEKLAPYGDDDITRIHLVGNNETLKDIAKHYYGSSDLWNAIYQENKDLIADADNVPSGTPLVIP